MCIGTDWLGRHTPRRPLAPLESLELAVTHGGFGTAERISAADALAAYTRGSAAAEGQAEDKGAIVPGMFADLVVLSGDPTQVAPDKIDELEVLLTIAGGRVVYRQGGFGLPAHQAPAAAHDSDELGWPAASIVPMLRPGPPGDPADHRPAKIVT